MQNMSNQIFERIVEYDAFDNPHPLCGINKTANSGRKCSISIEVDEDLKPPILVYYQIENFHQNHRKYARSRDLYQVMQIYN
jgi:LEM3 (ligand-effect modulator 3) family / CDC50 family